MTETYTASEALRLIKAKKVSGEYHVTGWLDLRGCDLSGVTLPQSIGGWLYLSGCDLSGVTLPQGITGSLYLRGCDLSGVTLPQSIGGTLYLRGARNPDPSQWWAECGEVMRCIAISDYALVQTDADKFHAGCRKNFTREQALKHWGEPRSDDRALAFRAAILAHELAT